MTTAMQKHGLWQVVVSFIFLHQVLAYDLAVILVINTLELNLRLYSYGCFPELILLNK